MPGRRELYGDSSQAQLALIVPDAQVRAGDAALRADLDAALAECERLAANQCKHPSGAIDSDHFRACGTNLW
jgi:hypothetical protein